MKPRKCLGGCNRWLTNEESIARGYGKHCAELHGIPPASPARRLGATPNRRPAATRTDPPAEHIPGQTALELTPFQPSPEEQQ